MPWWLDRKKWSRHYGGTENGRNLWLCRNTFSGPRISKILAEQHPGPYSPLVVVDAMLSFFLDRTRDLEDIDRNEFITHFTGDIRYHAILATKQGCVLRYATDETEQPVVLTRQEFFKLFPPKTVH